MFWEDKWCGSIPLARNFLAVFEITRTNSLFVRDCVAFGNEGCDQLLVYPF